MTFQYIRDFYSTIGQFEDLRKTAAYTDRMRGESTLRMIRKVNNVLNPLVSMLEIGPASGFITDYVSNELEGMESTHLDVMDVSDSYLNTVRNRKYNIREFIECDIMDERAMEEFNQSYQMILFQEVVEHLVNPFQALCNIGRILNDNGFLYLSLPNAYYWRYQIKTIFRKSKIVNGRVLMDPHISELAPLGAIRLASMAGFDVVDIDFYASRLPFLTTLTSTQLGLLLVKRCPPEQRWQDLTKQIVDHWKRMNPGNN